MIDLRLLVIVREVVQNQHYLLQCILGELVVQQEVPVSMKELRVGYLLLYEAVEEYL
jgi:hypothetical protein